MSKIKLPNRRIRKLAAGVFWGFLGILLTPSAQADFQSLSAHRLAVSTGGLILKNQNTIGAQAGNVALDYGAYLNTQWMITASYAHLFDISQFRSLLWGFDLGAGRCLGRCSTTEESLGDIVHIRTPAHWTLSLGGGISQRFFSTSSGMTAYSGFYLRTEAGIPGFSPGGSWIGRVQSTVLTKSGSSLQIFDISAGYAFELF